MYTDTRSPLAPRSSCSFPSLVSSTVHTSVSYEYEYTTRSLIVRRPRPSTIMIHTSPARRGAARRAIEKWKHIFILWLRLPSVFSLSFARTRGTRTWLDELVHQPSLNAYTGNNSNYEYLFESIFTKKFVPTTNKNVSATFIVILDILPNVV